MDSILPLRLGCWLPCNFLAFYSAGAARLSEGSSCQAISQWAFLAALPLVGAATWRRVDGRAGGLGSLCRITGDHGAGGHLRCPSAIVGHHVWQ